jgi:hypothetical protein
MVTFAVDPATNSPMVVLREVGGERVLTVVVGTAEAGAIAMQQMDVDVQLPLAVDVIKALLSGFGARMDKVVIEVHAERTLAARLYVHAGKTTHVLICRPADALSIAARCTAPLFVHEAVFDKALADNGNSPAQKLRQQVAALDVVDFGRYFLQ